MKKRFSTRVRVHVLHKDQIFRIDFLHWHIFRRLNETKARTLIARKFPSLQIEASGLQLVEPDPFEHSTFYSLDFIVRACGLPQMGLEPLGHVTVASFMPIAGNNGHAKTIRDDIQKMLKAEQLAAQ